MSTPLCERVLPLVFLCTLLLVFLFPACTAKNGNGPDGENRSETREEKGSGDQTEKPDQEKEPTKETDRNRLADATSPYLKMHADNPVDWHPWGEEAFQKAKEKDRPIFLSIGYYTCHWCHVMERKVFMNEDIARHLNESFISVKVDREQRPAVDHTYMTAAHRMGRRGGWPLSVFMTPDKKPFFIGTYIPPEKFKTLVQRLSKLWNNSNQRKKLIQNAERVEKALQSSAGASEREFGKDILHRTFKGLKQQFDDENAGFGTGQKFPSPHKLLFLLRYGDRTGKEKAWNMVTRTLDAMRRGGMYDHIGFGFHRYATDPTWQLPHFEKMLYDQALLTCAYTEAYQATEKNRFKRTAEETIKFVQRDLGSDTGAFYSALASGSGGEEGGEYIWSTKRVREVLNEELASLVIDVFQMKDEGNYQKESTGKKTGKNVLRRSKSIPELAEERGMDPSTLRSKLEAARTKMHRDRESRPQVGTDTKILTDWNGLMIAALSRAGRILDEQSYIERARRTANFILSTLRGKDGRLRHRYRNGNVGIAGRATDYAYLTWGLIELYQSTFETRWLRTALSLTDTFIKHYWDQPSGGFFFSADFEDHPMGRQKQFRDGARPSANSVALWNLLRLGRITAREELEKKARRIFSAAPGRYTQRPSSLAMMMVGVDFDVGPAFEVVIAGDPQAEDTQKMLRHLRELYVPRKVVLLRPKGDRPDISEIASYTGPQKPKDGRATAYVCQNYACELPTTSVEKMKKLLERTSGNSGTSDK